MEEWFEFYYAKERIGAEKEDVKVKVGFSDKGVTLNFEGSPAEFVKWFSGDIINYFRNNYNDFENVACFKPIGRTETEIEYDIAIGKSLFGKSDYVPFGSVFLYKGAFPLMYRNRKAIEKALKAIERLKKQGLSNKEISLKINNHE